MSFCEIRLAHEMVKDCRIFIFRSTYHCPWWSRSWVLGSMETVPVGDLWCRRGVVSSFSSRHRVTHQLRFDSIVSFLPPSTTIRRYQRGTSQGENAGNDRIGRETKQSAGKNLKSKRNRSSAQGGFSLLNAPRPLTTNKKLRADLELHLTTV